MNITAPDGGRKLAFLLWSATIATRPNTVPGSNQQQSKEPSNRDGDRLLPVSDRMLAIFLAALAAALVLGYLFVDKLADISRQEDCMLSRSRNCATIESPANR